MRYARFQQDGQTHYGVVEGDSVRAIDGDLFGRHQVTGAPVSLASVKLLAPVLPSKIIAAAVNYHSHAEASRSVLPDGEAPKQPELFLKPPSAVIAPGEDIVLPPDAGRVDYEGELVAVI